MQKLVGPKSFSPFAAVDDAGQAHLVVILLHALQGPQPLVEGMRRGVPHGRQQPWGAENQAGRLSAMALDNLAVGRLGGVASDRQSSYYSSALSSTAAYRLSATAGRLPAAASSS